jgi:hypothetical protein
MPRTRFALAFFAVLPAAIAASAAFAEEAPAAPADLKAQAADLVKEYSTALQATLKQAIDASGPVGGIAVCQLRAP